MRGKCCSSGDCTFGEEEDLCTDDPVLPQWGEQVWEAPGKCGLKAVFISDFLNGSKPLYKCAIP